MSRFFVLGYLPDLEFGVKPAITTKEVLAAFQENLTPHALQKLQVLRLFVDLSNIERTFLDEPFDSKGSFSKDDLKNALEMEEDLPNYVFAFFAEHESEKDRKYYFPKLLTTYFQEEIKNQSGFLRDFLEFEHDLRVVMAGVRAKKYQKDLERELQFEDMGDPLVRFVLMQKGSPGKFIFPFEFAELEKQLTAAGPSPTKQYLALMQYRFNFYRDRAGLAPFSLEAIFAYFMRLWTLEDIFLLSQEEGEALLDNLVENQHAS